MIKKIAQAFNDHFSKIGSIIKDSIVDTEVDPLSYVAANPDVRDFILTVLDRFI
jgi:hypothetical protein